MASYIRTADHLTVVFDEGDTVTVYPSNPQYNDIVAALNAKDYDTVRRLASPVSAVRDKIDRVVRRGVGKVELVDGVVYYNDKAIHNTLTDRIVQMATEGIDIEPMCKFLENLQLNPSYRAVTELYGFLEVGNLPITEDGHFLAYKRVRGDYTDCHTGKFSNAIGTVVEMPRNQVNEDPNQTCSAGLHFCSRDYLPNFGTDAGNRTVILKIHPADVVAIPTDYNNTKGRTCRYEVIGELEHKNEAPLEGAFRFSDDYVEPSDEDDRDYEDYDYGYDQEYDFVDELPNEGGDLALAKYFANLEHQSNALTTELEAVDPVYDIAVKAYASIEDAANDNGVTPSMIRRVLKGERKTTGGYGWRWSDTTVAHPKHLAAHHEHGTLKCGAPHGVDLDDLSRDDDNY